MVHVTCKDVDLSRLGFMEDDFPKKILKATYNNFTSVLTILLQSRIVLPMSLYVSIKIYLHP